MAIWKVITPERRRVTKPCLERARWVKSVSAFYIWGCELLDQLLWPNEC